MRKKLNLVQKFRKFFFSLPIEEQKALWDIMTALRSEDMGSLSLKLFTTSRIRGALFGESNTGFLGRALIVTNPRLAKKYLSRFGFGSLDSSPQGLKSLYKRSNIHFKDHFRMAVNALLKHGFKGKVKDLERLKSFTEI